MRPSTARRRRRPSCRDRCGGCSASRARLSGCCAPAPAPPAPAPTRGKRAGARRGGGVAGQGEGGRRAVAGEEGGAAQRERRARRERGSSRLHGGVTYERHHDHKGEHHQRRRRRSSGEGAEGEAAARAREEERRAAKRDSPSGDFEVAAAAAVVALVVGRRRPRIRRDRGARRPARRRRPRAAGGRRAPRRGDPRDRAGLHRRRHRRRRRRARTSRRPPPSRPRKPASPAKPASPMRPHGRRRPPPIEQAAARRAAAAQRALRRGDRPAALCVRISACLRLLLSIPMTEKVGGAAASCRRLERGRTTCARRGRRRRRDGFERDPPDEAVDSSARSISPNGAPTRDGADARELRGRLGLGDHRCPPAWRRHPRCRARPRFEKRDPRRRRASWPRHAARTVPPAIEVLPPRGPRERRRRTPPAPLGSQPSWPRVRAIVLRRENARGLLAQVHRVLQRLEDRDLMRIDRRRRRRAREGRAWLELTARRGAPPHPWSTSVARAAARSRGSVCFSGRTCPPTSPSGGGPDLLRIPRVKRPPPRPLHLHVHRHRESAADDPDETGAALRNSRGATHAVDPMLLRDGEPVVAPSTRRRPRALAGLSADVRAPFWACRPSQSLAGLRLACAVSRLRSHSRVDVVVLGAPPCRRAAAVDGAAAAPATPAINHSSILTGLCRRRRARLGETLADELSRLLQSALGRDVNVRVNVVARNAMRLGILRRARRDFSRHVCARRAPRHGAGRRGGRRPALDSIGEVVRAIRQLTRAAVTFVVWSKRSGNGHHSLPPKPPDACADAAKRWGDVASRGVDVLRADLLVHDVVRRLSHGAAASGEEDSPSRGGRGARYLHPEHQISARTAWAKHGGDVIHPPPEGHRPRPRGGALRCRPAARAPPPRRRRPPPTIE